MAHSLTIGLVGAVPATSSISKRVITIRILIWRNSIYIVQYRSIETTHAALTIPHFVHPTGLHFVACFARKSLYDRKL